MRKQWAILALVVLGFVSIAGAKTWYVDSGIQLEAPNGLSWPQAFKTIDQAITAASAYKTLNPSVGVEVWVKTGDYDTGQGAVNAATGALELKPNVAVYGGFVGTENLRDARPQLGWFGDQATIIEGTAALVAAGRAAYHVVTGAAGAVLDGFVITGGNADGNSQFGYGGGMYNQNCNTVVRNCLLTGNQAKLGGAGMYNDNTSSQSYPTLSACIFKANEAVSAAANGGAMYNLKSSPTISNCLFVSNSVGQNGGAICNSQGLPSIINCTFYGNSAAAGGALANLSMSSPIVKNCILWNNPAGTGIQEIYTDGTSSATVTYSDVQLASGVQAGGNNKNKDPLFVDAATDDFRVKFTLSPCWDAGTNGPDVPTEDIRGVSRPQPADGGIDMGACETASPIADFSYVMNPLSGYAPVDVTFTDASAPGPEGDLITAWAWTFGDTGSPSNTSTEQNPTHTYSKQEDATYTVRLTATSAAGSAEKTASITVKGPSNADFTGTPTSGASPLVVAFTDKSTGGYTSGTWDFGDGTATQPLTLHETVEHTYTSEGTFDVSLSIDGPGGASTKKREQYITVINKITADFSAAPLAGIAGTEVSFTNKSTGQYDTLTWDFGDGSAVSHDTNPKHVYKHKGSFTVTLTASGPGDSDTRVAVNPIVITAPTPGFSAKSPTTVVAPQEVCFKNETVGYSDTFVWDFGDGATLTQHYGDADPCHTYQTRGVYDVTLTTDGPASIKKTGFVTVYRAAVPAFKSDKVSGIADLVVKFTDQSTGDYSTATWDFGDGSDPAVAAPKAEVSHTYHTKGVFTVTLTLAGNGAPTPIVLPKKDLITVYARAQAAFSADKRKGVIPVTVQFQNNSTGDYKMQTWDFGDGNVKRLNFGDPAPAHTYATKGVYTVSLMLEGDGGTSKLAQQQFISAYAPVVANVSANPTEGSFPLKVLFTDLSTGDYDKARWDFGDETSVVETAPPTKAVSHTFDKAGTFTTTMSIADKDGVDHTKTVDIHVYTPAVAAFSADPAEGPYPLTVTFTNQSTGDYDTATWSFGDGSDPVVNKPPADTLTHTYTKKGTFTVSLKITGKGGTNEVVKSGLITAATSVTAAFTGTPRTGVAPLTVQFTNTSTGDYDRSMWDFDGDGSQDSGVQNPSFTYADPGVYKVSLTVSGPGGTKTISKAQYVKVYTPAVADFSAVPTSGLIPLTVQFTNLSTGDADKFAWDFDGDGNTDSTQRDPSFTYTQPGVYSVTLTAKGLGGTSKKTRTDLISAYHPVLSVSPTTIHLGSWTGSGYPVAIENIGNGTLTWKASVLTGSDWLDVSPSGEFTGNGEALLSYAENFQAESRTGSITIEAPDAQNSPVTITVIQDGTGNPTTPHLSVSPEQAPVGAANGALQVGVDNIGAGTLEWTAYVRQGGSWLSITSGGTGTNAGAIGLAYARNDVTEARTGVVRVRGVDPAAGYVDVVVTQAAAPLKPLLTVTPPNQTVGSGKASTSFDVFNPNGGTMYWTAQVTAGGDWLTISNGLQGTSDGRITVDCAANRSSSPRTGTIRVASSNANGSPVDVTVSQNGSTGGCYAGADGAGSGMAFTGDSLLMSVCAAVLLAVGTRAAGRLKSE